MKFCNWKYNDMSDPKVPNRHITWEFGIPYLLKVNGSVFGFHGGYSFNIWFLCFGFDLITDVSCGKVTKIRFRKWYISFVLRRGWSSEFCIGIDRMRFHSWKMKRFYNKCTSEQMEEVINRLESLGKERIEL